MSYNSLLGLGASSVDANLLCHLPMQETAGTAVDDRSGNTYDGTLSGSAIANGTGPNSYLTSSYDMNGSDHIITLNASLLVTGTGVRTFATWVKSDAGADTRILQLGNNNGAQVGQGFSMHRRNTDAQLAAGFYGHGVHCGNNTFPASTWIHAAIRVPASSTTTDDVDILIDGVNQSLTTYTGSAQTLNTTNGDEVLGGGNNGSPLYFPGEFAGFVAFDRALSDAEVLEIASGPEPENTAAPTVSGDTAQGSTLTCSPGTWALPSPFASGSNGTITYTYQWTRDGSNISGATSSTYVTQAADIGTAVGCKVLGANDGGSSSAEETASSNTISVVSAATDTYRMNMRLFIPTQV